MVICTLQQKKVITCKNELEQFKIGHTQKSKTKTVKSFTNKKSNIVFCDTPGYGDTQGVEVDVVNCHHVQNTINNCKSMLPILLIPLPTLLVPRKGSKQLIELANRIFKKPIENLKSTLIWVSHGKNATINEVNNSLIGSLKYYKQHDDIKENEKKQLINITKTLLEQLKNKRVIMFNPVD